MRKLLILLILLFLPCAARAEIHVGAEVPDDWHERGLLRVTILQTGRSDAILVECGGEAMLIDGGDDSWEVAVRHDLEARNLTAFRYFLNTHPHNDHIEGLLHLLEQGYLPEKFMSPHPADWTGDSYHKRAVHLAWDSGVPFRLIRHGDVYPLGGASVHIFRSTEHAGLNSTCAIQLITFGDSRILLCADLTGNGQKSLLTLTEEGALQAEIVKAPHHGINAMTPEFLTAVDPALILCTNEQHAAPDLQRQADSRELPLLYSGEGEIVLETDGTDWYVFQKEKTGRDR